MAEEEATGVAEEAMVEVRAITMFKEPVGQGQATIDVTVHIKGICLSKFDNFTTSFIHLTSQLRI